MTIIHAYQQKEVEIPYLTDTTYKINNENKKQIIKLHTFILARHTDIFMLSPTWYIIIRDNRPDKTNFNIYLYKQEWSRLQ